MKRILTVSTLVIFALFTSCEANNDFIDDQSIDKKVPTNESNIDKNDVEIPDNGFAIDKEDVEIPNNG